MSLFTLSLAPILSILKKFVQGSSIKKLTHWNSGRAYVCQIRFHNSGSSWRKSPLFTTFSQKSKAGRDLHTSALQRVALEPLCPHFAESSRCCSSQFFFCNHCTIFSSVLTAQPGTHAHTATIWSSSTNVCCFKKWPKKSPKILLSIQCNWTFRGLTQTKIQKVRKIF